MKRNRSRKKKKKEEEEKEETDFSHLTDCRVHAGIWLGNGISSFILLFLSLLWLSFQNKQIKNNSENRKALPWMACFIFQSLLCTMSWQSLKQNSKGIFFFWFFQGSLLKSLICNYLEAAAGFSSSIHTETLHWTLKKWPSGWQLLWTVACWHWLWNFIATVRDLQRTVPIKQ